VTRIAFVAVSGKPVHAGHFGLINIAAKENDVVRLFVSLSDRRRPGEVPILGSDMKKIWHEQLENIMPGNVEITYGGSPVAHVWEELGEANEEGSEDTFTIYADPTDLTQNYPENSLKKYADNLFANGQIILRPTERSETVNVSGTKMRKFLSTGDKKSFIACLPAGVNGNVIWNVLSSRAKEVSIKKPIAKKKPVRRGESLIRSYVKLLVN